jgi:hypothetical protein
MIDRRARNRLAEEIRHFVECFTDNFQFDDAAWEIETKDRGVTEIYEAMWLTYDDLTRHKMDGAHALSYEQLTIVKRAIVFLKSDCEYKWPSRPLYYRVARPLLWVISLGIVTKRLDKHFHGNGDDEAWPFFKIEDYQTALKSPSYLNGTDTTALQPRQAAMPTASAELGVGHLGK